MSTPAIFRMLEGKVPHEVIQAFELLFKGTKDTSDAVKHLKGQHDDLAKQVTTTTKTANAAATQASAAATAIQQPVAAGQVNPQNVNYALQQQDHMGAVVLQGTAALAVTLNNLVNAPYKTRIMNQSTQTATLTPTTGTVNGSASVNLTAGASYDTYFDGVNWWVA